MDGVRDLADQRQARKGEGRQDLLLLRKLRLYLGAVRFEHSIFALPFAYLGAVIALDGLPTLRQFLWITVAMVSARTLAMGANRIIDREQDARNPRTAGRALPRGLLGIGEMVALCLVSLGLFFLAAAMLHPLALKLAPIAAFVMVLYPYTKRFTWASHIILGWADAIALAGAWIAVTGTLPWEAVLLSFAVAMWIGGFDVLYACQDYEFDVQHRLRSIPQRFGIPSALWWARAMHLATSSSLLAAGLWLGLAWPYYIGWGIASALLIYEHRLVSPTDLSRLNVAFFNVNGYIAVVVFLFTMIAVLL